MTVSMRSDDRATILGFSFPSLINTVADGGIIKSKVLPAAKVGQLTTRTNNTEGELTMAGGHGITTGDRLDLYWSGGSRRGITVGTVATNAVPLTDSGSGDNLPTNMTAITAMVPEEEEFVFTGDNAKGLAYYAVHPSAATAAQRKATIVLAEGDDTEITHQTLNSGVAAIWSVDRDDTIPTAGELVEKAFFSHASSTTTCEMRVAAVYD